MQYKGLFLLVPDFHHHPEENVDLDLCSGKDLGGNDEFLDVEKSWNGWTPETIDLSFYIQCPCPGKAENQEKVRQKKWKQDSAQGGEEHSQLDSISRLPGGSNRFIKEVDGRHFLKGLVKSGDCQSWL